MSKEKEKEWDLVIGAKPKFFDLNLKSLWRYRDLLFLFVKRDFVAQFKQTILGPLWYIIQPLLTTFIYIIIFSKVAKIPTSGLPPLLFYLSGLVVWNFFAACINKTSSTFVSNAHIFGKVYFPRLSVPLSIVISNLVTFGIQFVLFLCFLFYFVVFRSFDLNINSSVLLLPWLLLIMAALGLGLGIIVSSLTTKYRDFTHLVGFGVQLLMYASPVIYASSILPPQFSFLVKYNPLAPVIEAFRFAFFGQGMLSYTGLVYSTVVAFAALVIGAWNFSRVEKDFMDTV